MCTIMDSEQINNDVMKFLMGGGVIESCPPQAKMIFEIKDVEKLKLKINKPCDVVPNLIKTDQNRIKLDKHRRTS